MKSEALYPFLYQFIPDDNIFSEFIKDVKVTVVSQLILVVQGYLLKAQMQIDYISRLIHYKIIISFISYSHWRFLSMRTLIPRLKASFSTSMSSQQCRDLQDQYGCHNYAPLPVVIERAKGVEAYDCEGKRYLDFLSAYSAVNQGHCHPKILETLTKQAQKLTLTSRAVHSSLLGETEEYMSKTFGYDKVLFMNTGVEGGESAIKMARRWAYATNRVKDNQATILFAKGNFWGRTIAACASSDDPERFQQFGPYGNLGFKLIDYGSTEALEAAFKQDPSIVAYMVQPIQGEKGVIIPPDGYLKKAQEICKKHNALLICDQVQTGLGRTGKFLCVDYEDVRPDILILGKSLSGGFLPVSAVLADDYIMNHIKPGQHGSTYGGSALACAVTKTSIEVIKEEGMVQNSFKMGQYLRDNMKNICVSSRITQLRGKGLFTGLQFEDSDIADQFATLLLENGLIAKPTQRNIIRFSPPLCITKQEMDEGISIIQKSWDQLKKQI